MKTDVLLMTVSSLLLWAATATQWAAFGPDLVTYVLLYLSVGALFALGMCADLLRAREADRSTVLILWVTQTVTWVPWNLVYVFNMLHRIYTSGDEP